MDRIWHLACPASPKNYQIDPIRTLRTSFLGTYNMLELALKNNARILLASTSEIYGDPEVHPQKENYNGNVNTTGIRSCYDEGKRVAETLCFDYGRTKNVDIRIVRIFNTYGPNMQPDDGRVVSNFIVQALENKDITIYGKELNRGPVISFNINGIHSYDFCQIMGQYNISLRSGNHCAQPLLNHFNTNSSSRISFHIYNEIDELNFFEDTLKKTITLLS